MASHRLFLTIAASCSIMTLAACSDEPALQAPAPEAQTEEQQPATPPEKPAAETAKEGLESLRDAANQLVEDAKPALDQARKSAEEALKDAQPTIDKARDAAKEIGTAIDQIVRKAQDDFKRATEALDKRLDEVEAGDNSPAADGDPAATLAAADSLRTDTRAAARAAAAGVGPGYVGVWVKEAADCAKIDQEPVEIFAVVTPTTIRRYESVCNMPETPLADGTAEVTAQCVGEGEVEDRIIRLSVPSPDALTIAGAEGTGVDLVRCHLPE